MLSELQKIKLHLSLPFFNPKTMKNNIPLIPENIAETIQYSTNSIVSKIIIKNEKLQITLFAVAEGESFEEHTTTKEAIVHIVEGEGEFYLKNEWIDFKTNDYFFMPADLVHAIKAKTDFKFLLYLF